MQTVQAAGIGAGYLHGSGFFLWNMNRISEYARLKYHRRFCLKRQSGLKESVAKPRKAL